MPRKARKRRLKDTKTATHDPRWGVVLQAIKDTNVSANPEGWAEPGWNSWVNAARLALTLWSKHTVKLVPTDVIRAGNELLDTLDDPTTWADPESYWLLADWRSELRSIYSDVPASLGLEAAFAITQLGISRSDGGGCAFADRLAGLFRAFETANIDITEAVKKARLHDALGTNPDPKRAEAFKSAWELGRFKLAYLICS